MARAMNEGGATQKRLDLLPLRRPSVKHPCATSDGSQSLLSSVLSGSSSIGLPVVDREKGARLLHWLLAPWHQAL